MSNIEFSTLHKDGTVVHTATLTHEQVMACPRFILVPEHYNDDGTCKCPPRPDPVTVTGADLATREAVEAFVTAALQDGATITDVASDYGEPGYSLADGAVGILFGDWNNYPGDVNDALGEFYELEWCDEWIVADGKAWRTQADSYSWRSSILVTDGGEVLTPDDDIEDWVSEVANDPRRALTSRTGSELEAVGFERWNGEFANDWYGNDADPVAISAQIRAEHEDVDIVFVVTSVAQFGVDFEAYYR